MNSADWPDLFERAGRYGVDVTAIEDALAARRGEGTGRGGDAVGRRDGVDECQDGEADTPES